MSSKKITLIDYGASNLLNVQNAFEHIGAQVDIATKPEQIAAAQRIVFPGVGSFPSAIEQLQESELFEAIIEGAQQKPFLGICLGMQLLLSHSNEFTLTQGLNLIPGTVTDLPKSDDLGNPLRVPHTGWATLSLGQEHPLFSGVEENTAFYFVHSFHGVLDDMSNLVATTKIANMPITASIAKDNVIGCQFHPEKSGKAGLTLLDNFLNI